ncbi:hypothetical protein TNCV_1786142 [Trichonephila clavipes]|nr:hypothetical protein TNCV_1786142 [Trichonephila clavipes]
MLAKKSSGYRQVPLADIGSPIQIVLSTPDDSECEEDTFDKVSDITIESGNSLSLQACSYRRINDTGALKLQKPQHV